jgi:hypothetical protein
MSEHDEWFFQVSPKLADGTLINVRGRTGPEFAQNLEILKGSIPLVMAMMRELSTQAGQAPANPMPAALQAVQQGMPGAQVVEENQYTCKHGNRVLRKSKPGAARDWTGYFCPTDRGTPDQCPPVFVN